MNVTIFLLVAMYMLWGYLGVASLAGLTALVLLMVLNGWLAAKVKKYQVSLWYCINYWLQFNTIVIIVLLPISGNCQCNCLVH